MARLQVIKGGSGSLGMGFADYIWVGENGLIGFKKKTILVGKDSKGDPVPLVPRWSFSACDCEDVSPNHQCDDTRDHILSPCFYLPDPTRPAPSYIVLCEVRDTNDTCPPENYRSALRKAMKVRGPTSKLLWFGFEQGYVLKDADRESPSPNLAERRFLTSERHMGACFDAGLMLHSAWNPSWAGECEFEFKVGVRGFPQDLDPDPTTALIVTDHLMIAQYLLEKVGNEKGLVPIWHSLSLFVSTPELREPGGDSEAQAQILMKRLAGDGLTLRGVPNPVNSGIQCIEVSLDGYANPYKLALDVLEAIWPLDAQTIPSVDDDEEEDDQP